MTSGSHALQPARDLAPSADADFAADTVAGLSAAQKRIPPKYFYDDEGSRLFEEITRQPEYYPTRAELEILQRHAGDIADALPQDAALIEFGGGACTKVRHLLDAAPQVAVYVPVDIAGDFMRRRTAALVRDYPRLAIRPVRADFTNVFALPPETDGRPRAGFFPGSTIGNFDPHEASAFLRNAKATLGPGAAMIVGVDLVKDPDVLNAAYNDAAGVTARFNLNLLRRMNRELGGSFKLDCFEHHAFYNRHKNRIEMHLASLKRQKVKVAGATFDFRAGETIHTENSWKYSADSFRCLVRGSGWTPRAMWTDGAGLFSVHVLALT
jgi:dimethylhistidine N-methyltransferase